MSDSLKRNTVKPKPVARSKKTVKPFLYSQLGTSARPLDRIRRPAASNKEAADLTSLIADLDTLPVDDFAGDVAAAAPIETTKKHFLNIKTMFRRSTRSLLFVGLAIIFVLAGLLVTERVALNRSNQKARQADAQWQQDQAQWQCELQKYRVQQSEAITNQFEETTCQ